MMVEAGERGRERERTSEFKKKQSPKLWITVITKLGL